MPTLSRTRVLVFIGTLILLRISYLSLPTPSNEPKILLVSAYYPLAKSKHTHEQYGKWMELYLSKVKTHIYFFAPQEMEETVRKLRGNLPMTLNTTFASPFDIPPLEGLEDRYADMNKIDPENAYHSPELYAIWSSKTYFVREALLNMQSLVMDVRYVF